MRLLKQLFTLLLFASVWTARASEDALIVRMLDPESSRLAIAFKAPQRGILDTLTLMIPEAWGTAWQNSVTINAIGRGAVVWKHFSEQSIGRYGSRYSRRSIGKVSIGSNLANDCYTITIHDVDLRPDNGIDIELILQDVQCASLPIRAYWHMSTLELPDSLQGELYTVHDPHRRHYAESRFQPYVPINHLRHDARQLGLKGDGATDDTDVLNEAIRQLHAAGGGEIDFPDGTFCLRTVHLLSHVWLHIGQDATLQAIRGLDEHEPTWFADYNHEAGFGTFDESVYDQLDCYMVKQDVGHSFFRNAMFYAQRAEDIRIYGSGRITGAGVIDSGNGVMRQPDGLRADKMMAFKLCRDIEIGGEDCPSDLWYHAASDGPCYLASDGSDDLASVSRMLDVDQGGHFVILATGTDDIRVHDINCGRLSLNRARDMFDFMSCNRVKVRNIYCRHCGDDIVKLGSDCSLGFTRKSEEIEVRNIIGDTRCNLFQIGSETADDITDVYVDNICVLGTNKAGFSISSNDGGTVARVWLNSGKTGPLHHRSVMHRTRTPIFLSISNRGRVIGAEVGRYTFTEQERTRTELLVKNINIGRVEDIYLQHFDSDEVYAGADGSADRWHPYDGSQPESTPIIAGFKVPDAERVQGGLDFTLPDGRMTGHIERVFLHDISITVKGGHPASDALRICPEIGVGHFNIRDLEVQPSYGLWARHVKDLYLEKVTFRTEQPDGRPEIILDDVTDAKIDGQIVETK